MGQSIGPGLSRFLAPGPVSATTGLALLVLRVWLGVMMLMLHGWPKVANFAAMSARFADPFHVGAPVSLSLSIVAELVCAALVAAGAGNRPAALLLVFNMITAFVVGHGMRLTGPRNGELAFVYLAVFVALLIAGPGRYSVDRLLFSRRR